MKIVKNRPGDPKICVTCPCGVIFRADRATHVKCTSCGRVWVMHPKKT